MLDAVVVVCAMILNPLAKRRRKRLQAMMHEDATQPESVAQPSLSMRDIETSPTTEKTGRRIDSGGVDVGQNEVDARNGA